ncbi:MAG: hypothetical protein ACKVX9_19255 [Blastocatellia bacterium]
MIRLIVVSPGDVMPERRIVGEVVENVNKLVAAYLGLGIETYRWETDTFPGFHIDGPQGLVDEALAIDDCEIMVGIFWKRFGTPTKDAGSGTEHELLRAYDGWKRSQGKRPHIMVYFKTEPYSPKSKDETDQWGKVLEFKQRFSTESLFWDFQTTAEFEQLFRDHLTKYLIQNAGKYGARTSKLITASERLRAQTLKIVDEAEEVLFITGSRSHNHPYLQRIEERLRANPNLDHYRVLIGPPHYRMFKDHLLRVLAIPPTPAPSQTEQRAIQIGIIEDTLSQPEFFILGNEHEVFIVLPSFSEQGEFDSGIIFTGTLEVRGLRSFVRELYLKSRKLDTDRKIKALKVSKDSPAGDAKGKLSAK